MPRVLQKGDLPLPPAKKVAVLACMDARLDPAKALGLQEGDAHVIRNAGGVATEDALRSLVISQRLLGTEEIILVHHTDCGMETFSDDAVKEQIPRRYRAPTKLCAWRPSPRPKKTSNRRPPASKPTPSSRKRTSVASCTKSKPAGCGKSLWDNRVTQSGRRVGASRDGAGGAQVGSGGAEVLAGELGHKSRRLAGRVHTGPAIAVQDG